MGSLHTWFLSGHARLASAWHWEVACRRSSNWFSQRDCFLPAPAWLWVLVAPLPSAVFSPDNSTGSGPQILLSSSSRSSCSARLHWRPVFFLPVGQHG